MESKASLFEKMGVSYNDICVLAAEQKMCHVREYARKRLKPGERLWWLEDEPGEEKTLPIEVRLYMKLPREEKTALRAEGAILYPQIVGGSRVKK